MFSEPIFEKLGYYVYFLQDPRSGQAFYVGKGRANRIFNHLAGAAGTDKETDKLDKIREIINSGHSVRHWILRHGLTEQTAFEIEASLIDFIGIDSLSNFQTGRYSSDYGLKTTDEISAMYSSKELSTSKRVLLVNINKRYHREMTDEELYQATRESWVVGAERRKQVEYAIATYRGLTREVYEVHDWYPIEVDGKVRWGFRGSKASDEIRDELRYKTITSYFKKGASNPIRYINCS